jgi:integrase
MAELRQRDATAAKCLEVLILTATRSSEVLKMRWGEIDFLTKTWVIPAQRMKAQREHRVPLAPRVVALFETLPRSGDAVFALARNALRDLLASMERSNVTVHGFRSCFRTWAAERTNYSSEVAEMALAHVVGTRVERAYARSDLFERRRRLMCDWADHCDGKTPTVSADVIAIRA